MGFTGGSIQRHGNRYYVQLYWKGQIEKFWSVLIQGLWHPIKNEENGYKLLYAIWHEACRQAAIRIKLYNALRHSLGCQLLDEGQDLAFVQQVLGHESPSMTKRYAQRTAKKIATVLSMRRGRVAVDKTVEIIE